MKLKRQSNKKRKLEYIRTKNSIRKGCFIIKDIKCSQLLIEDTVYNILPTILLNASKKYKLPLGIDKYKVGIMGSDFLLELVTIRIYIKLNQ